MNKSIVKTFLISFTTLLYGMAISIPPAIADDTDVYIQPVVNEKAEPLVMMMIDFRANTNQNICNTSSTDADDIADGTVGNCGGLFSASIAQAILDNGGLNGVSDTNVSLVDQVLGALRVVIDTLDGVKVGLMMAHDNTATGNNQQCVGPTHGQGATLANDRCSNGAFIMQGLTRLPSGAAAIKSKIASIPDPAGANAHPYQATEMMFEYYRYLSGQQVFSGNNGWDDFQSPNTANLNDALDLTTVDWDSSIQTGSGNNFSYISPFVNDADECAKIYAIHINFGTNNGYNSSDDGPPIEAAVDLGGLGTTISSSTPFSDILVHMQSTDLIPDVGTAPANIPVEVDGTQNITSYIIAKTTNNTQDGWAQDGQGDPAAAAISLSDDPDAMVAEITAVFAEILSVSTTFVAPSVPVNVFNRSQTERELFLALFDPDEDRLPFWPGNLKKLNINIDTLALEDQRGDQAIDPSDGRLRRGALTEWTDPNDTNLDIASEDADIDDDGRDVQKGGGGSRIPGYLSGDPGDENSDNIRQMYYSPESGLADLDLTPLNATSTTGIALFDQIAIAMNPFPQNAGATDAADYNDAIAADQARITGALEWIRGYIGDGTTTIRDWWLGDPLHSRPVTINYGIRTGGFSTTNPDIRIVFGTNDGLFHMFQNTLSSSQSAPDTDGMENWAFAPQESMDLWDRLRQNTQDENPLHPIAVDGSTAVWANDVNGDSNLKASDNDEVWAFFGMRRGGKSYYALDITDPDDPRFMWRISKYDTPYTAGYDTTPTIDSDFEELGLTFSTPAVGQMSIDTDNDTGTPNETVTVLIFGGGYNGDDGGDNLVDDNANANWNDTTASTGANFGKDQINRDFNLDNTLVVGEEDYDANTSEGNAIFIVNAETGALIWKAGRIDGSNTIYNSASKKLGVPDMEDSIPSDVAAIDTTGNGFLDRLYVGDTGGRVWRFDIANSLPDNWTATKMLDAGRFVGSGLDNDRRFFNRPDVVQTVDDTGPYDAVLIGSGDRENPNMAEVEDAFFLIKDRAITSGSPSATNYTHSTSSSDQSLADLTSDACATGDVSCDTTKLTSGWFIDLGLGTTNTGQKNLSAALTLGGIVFFSTFAPDATGCGVSEGTGRQFALSLQDATAAFNFDDSGDGSFERFDALESGGIPVEPVSLGDDVLLFQGQGGDDGDVDGDGDVDDDDAALADLDNLRAIGVRTSWTTYWYELEN